MNPETALAAYDRTGAAIVADFVDAAAVAELQDEFERLADAAVGSTRKGAIYGIRGLLKKSALSLFLLLAS